MGRDEQDLLDFLDFVEAELASAKARDKYEQSHVDKLEEIKIKIKDKLKQAKNNSDNSQYAYRPSPEQQKREREEQEQWREAVRQRARQEEEARKAKLEEARKAREARENEEKAARQRQQAEQEEQIRAERERQRKKYMEKLERERREAREKYEKAHAEEERQEKERAERQRKEREKINQDQDKLTVLINNVFKKINVDVRYYIQDEATSSAIEVTYPTDTDEFYLFIQKTMYLIDKKYIDYISKMSLVGNTREIDLVTAVMNKFFEKVNEKNKDLERKAKRRQLERDYLPKYKIFFNLLDIEILYILKSKITSELVQVTHATDTDEFYEFIEEKKNKISTQSRKFMLKNKSAVLGNVDPDSQEAQDVRLVNDVKDHIFRKLFVNPNIAYILKLLHKRLLVLEARAESNLPLRRCSRIAG